MMKEEEKIKTISLTLEENELRSVYNILVTLYNADKLNVDLNDNFNEELPLRVLNYFYAKLVK